MSEVKEMSKAQSQDVEVGECVNADAKVLSGAHVDVKNASKDKALGFLASHHVDFDPNSAEAKRVLRKIDMRVMPIAFTLYLLQLLDKNSLSFAAIMGIRKETHLTPFQYSWLGSIVYFGYLGGDIPATFLMQRFPLAKYLACMSMLWGIIVALHAACHNFAGLAVVRLLLGMIEVCTVPAVLHITATWYTKSEQITRIAIWYTTSGWAQVVGGFLSWCIYHSDTFRWQAIFVLYGGATFVFGIVMYFFLSASPMDAPWLNEAERAIALERVRNNKTGTEIWSFNREQLLEALRDIRIYIVFLLLVSTGLPNGGLTAFGPTVIAGFGFTVKQTTLLSMAPGAGQVVGTLVALWVAKVTNRTVAGIYTLLLGCVGAVMMLAIPAHHNTARYGGYILVLQFPITILSIMSFMTGGVAGSTKKLAFGVSYQLGYAVGNIIGPQTYRADSAPNYYPAKYTMLAFMLFGAILIAVYGLIHWSWNKRRDRQDAADAQNGTPYTPIENEEFMDITDFNLRSFRYPL